jgi:hypothetical protein
VEMGFLKSMASTSLYRYLKSFLLFLAADVVFQDF